MTDFKGLQGTQEKISVVTIKLYDEDAYATEFGAEIVEISKDNDCIYLVLDRTLFFPEEGGQSPDTGNIGGFEVVDVQISGDTITHTIRYSEEAESALIKGKTVRGHVNWDKRFSNMQNHTGEHILSGILHNEYRSENVGFHLSDNTVTLDTSRYLTEAELSELEFKANRAVYANLEIRAEYLPDEELERLEYRSKKEIEGAVRIVAIGDIDKCACCAPHVHHTGEVGLIKITKAIKWKEGTRIWFLCGSRALEYVQTVFKNVDEVARLTSESPDKIADGVKRFNETIQSLKADLFQAQSGFMEEKIKNISDIKSDVILFENVSNSKIQRNAVNALVERFDGVCGVFSTVDNISYQYIIGSKNRDCREVGRVLNEKLGAKGGGKPEMIQGSVAASREAIIGALKETLDI